jgi:thioredoxin 1
MSSENVVMLKSDTFESQVLKSDKLVVVDFWAQWCNPCKAVAPILDELAVYFENKVCISKINVDEFGDIAAKYRIMSVPTIILFKYGEIVEKIIGLRSKEEYISKIEEYM